MNKRTKQKIVCVVLLALGAGLIIGGAFFAPLLIPGVPIFVGGLGVAASIVEDKDKIAFNTTINNIHNHECAEHRASSAAASTPGPMLAHTETQTINSTYNFSASARMRIDSWNSRLRDLFAKAPKEMSNQEGQVPPLMFTHNYHYPAPVTADSELPKLNLDIDSILADKPCVLGAETVSSGDTIVSPESFTVVLQI